jgi:hypothetical protein
MVGFRTPLKKQGPPEIPQPVFAMCEMLVQCIVGNQISR